MNSLEHLFFHLKSIEIEKLLIHKGVIMQQAAGARPIRDLDV